MEKGRQQCRRCPRTGTREEILNRDDRLAADNRTAYRAGMKPRIAFVVILLVAVNNLFAQAALPAAAPAKASKPESKPAAPAPAKTPAAPGAKAEAKKDDKKKEEEKEGKIAGQTIARANGTFLGLEVVDGNFKLSFYDKKKKPMAVDMDRANFRWVVTGKADNLRAVLTPSGDGKSMTTGKYVKPPYNFKVFITLVKGEGENAQTESHTVDFRS